jgi:hypothetical protein
MAFNVNALVSALTVVAREASESAGRLQLAAKEVAAEQIEKLEAAVKEEVANKLLAIIAQLGK